MRPVERAALALLVIGSTLWWVDDPRAAECGKASWYGTESGNRTASGERFTGADMTAAHRSLPFGTRLRVTYRGRNVVVRVNDRGPAAWTHRVLDLSRAAAVKLGMIQAGVGRVCIEKIQ